MSDLPKPLVPADVDLRGLPFMPLDVVRLTDSDIVALSTGEEFKAAVILWAKCWLQVPAASLPDDDRILAHLSGAGARWKRVKAMALHGFVLCADGRWYHPVIAEKAAEAWKHRQAQRDRANRRWQCDGSPAAHAAAPNNDAAAHAAAYPTAMQGTGTGTGTEETTEFCFSTESDSEKPSSTSVSAARKNSRAKNRSPIPADWQPSEVDRQYAIAKGYDDTWIAAEAEAFRDRNLKTGTLYADHAAAWRTWVQNAPKFAGKSGVNGHVNDAGLTAAASIVVAAGRAVREFEEDRRRNRDPAQPVLEGRRTASGA